MACPPCCRPIPNGNRHPSGAGDLGHHRNRGSSRRRWRAAEFVATAHGDRHAFCGTFNLRRHQLMSDYNEYIVGQVIVLQDLITNPFSTPTPNVPVDDPTDAVIVYKPDGTTVTLSVVHGANGSGAYSGSIALDQPGWWTYVWRATTTGAGAKKKSFYVAPVP